MLRSLLHYPGGHPALAAGTVLSAAALAFSLSSHSDPYHSPVYGPGGDVRLQSSEELLWSGDQYPLDEQQICQRLMNAQWLEQGSREDADNPEGGEALRLLAKGALKSGWQALVRKDPSFNTYTPVVEGRLAVQQGGGDLDLRLTGNGLKLRYSYAF